MKHPVIWLIAVVVTLSVAPERAAAQQPSAIWTSADGVFSVAIPPGWASVPDPSAGDERLLTIGSPIQQADIALRQCVIDQRGMSRGRSVSQDQLNTVGTENTAESMNPNGSVNAFRNEIVQGVRVFFLDESIGAFRHLQMIFHIARPQGFVQYTLSCGASRGQAADQDIAAMQAFMSSITINREALQ
jgi:hypothetical protein